jgi:hypothetical protein
MRNVPVGTDLVVVDGDTLQLQIVVSFVKILIETVLVGNDLPELTSQNLAPI